MSLSIAEEKENIIDNTKNICKFIIEQIELKKLSGKERVTIKTDEEPTWTGSGQSDGNIYDLCKSMIEKIERIRKE